MEFIIKQIEDFKKNVLTEASLKFIFGLSGEFAGHYYRDFGRLTEATVTQWCQNLLEANYDSFEIRICAMEWDHAAFKKIISALNIQLPSKLEFQILGVIFEVIYLNSNMRDMYEVMRAADHAYSGLWDYEKINQDSEVLLKTVSEIYAAVERIAFSMDDYYPNLCYALRNYSKPKKTLDPHSQFYVEQYSESELKHMIVQAEKELFAYNDALISLLIETVSSFSFLAQPVLRLL